MIELKMEDGNDCGAFVAAATALAFWTKQKVIINHSQRDLYFNSDDQWVSIEGRDLGDGQYEMMIENAMDIQFIKGDWQDQEGLIERAQVEAIRKADEMGLFNG